MATTICAQCASEIAWDQTCFLVGSAWVCSEECAYKKQGIQSPFGSSHQITIDEAIAEGDEPDPHPRRT